MTSLASRLLNSSDRSSENLISAGPRYLCHQDRDVAARLVAAPAATASSAAPPPARPARPAPAAGSGAPPRPPRAASVVVVAGCAPPPRTLGFSGGLVGDPQVQRERLVDLGVERLRPPDDWSLQRGARLAEPDDRRLVAVGGVLVEVNPIRGVLPAGHLGFLAVGVDRPRKPLVAEVLGHLDREDAILPSRQKVRRLPDVGSRRLEHVVGADRNVQNLFLIAVVVAEEEHFLAVLRGAPPFEGGVHRLALHAERLERQRPGRLRRLGRLRLTCADHHPGSQSTHHRQGRDRGPRRRLHGPTSVSPEMS